MQLPYSGQLNISRFSHLFDNKSESYKLFWFRAVMYAVSAGMDTVTYGELIDCMIADAWYMVTEYHLNLGPSDAIEKAVSRLADVSGMRSGEKRQAVLDYLSSCTDKELMRMKSTLSLNVPYRLQAPLMESMKGREWDIGSKALTERINTESGLIYYFIAYDGLNTRIHIQPDWMEYLSTNSQIIEAWIELNLITYLQRRNPSVPGIVDKLYPPQERKLEKVKKYWRLVMELSPVREIYSGILLDGSDVSIDHFVPWSYVAHDELWNLHPTTKSINSSKSNSLPDWDAYFPSLCRLEYMSYGLMQSSPAVRGEFEKCAAEHLNSSEVRGRLYRSGLTESEFSSRLEEVISPVYEAAASAGFPGRKLGA